MPNLTIVLKNGKVLTSSEAPMLQIFRWRKKLLDGKRGKTIYIPGIPNRLEPDWISYMKIENVNNLFDRETAGALMMAEPHAHWRNKSKNEIYQYSSLSDDFEVYYEGKWTPKALKQGFYERLGYDTVLK